MRAYYSYLLFQVWRIVLQEEFRYENRPTTGGKLAALRGCRFCPIDLPRRGHTERTQIIFLLDLGKYLISNLFRRPSKISSAGVRSFSVEEINRDRSRWRTDQKFTD
ncbi:unnamed protein product [Nesidiocoris tenuis]|uniref:Uncharacterized protein n=1 Tax=Nesidiocoris tenuis TaxID=355587 RepID=A0A6H5HUP5_9HEMI|nr:unnamed protein product [Nesidiocoris tenuis]